MKKFFRTNIVVTICLLITACGQVSQVTLTESATPSPADSPTPIQTATPTIDIYALPTFGISSPPTFAIPDGTNIPFPTPDPRIPTFLPTIDPNLVSNLLNNSISIRTTINPYGLTQKQITDWDYGFRQQYSFNQQLCSGYQWLDANHLILYPRTGEGWRQVMDGSVRGDLSSEHVVINLTNGEIWMRPPYSVSTYEWDCETFYWSQELGLIINQENIGNSYASHEGISTYTFDGKQVARYWGKIIGVSPNGTKILVDDDTIIDLSNGKTTDLAWYMNYDIEGSSKLYLSSDETQLYKCCFYYADLKTGKSYNLEWSDLRGIDGKPISFSLRAPHIGGQWVRNDTYFFPTWSYMSDAGDPRVIFSPTEKKYYFIELPSASVINPETMTYTFSPDGIYAWITGFSYGDGSYHSFLVNLTNLETTPYDIPGNDFFWSSDSKYGWVSVYDKNINYILSVTSKKLEPFPINPDYYDEVSWHPKENALAYMAEDSQTLAILNTEDMTIQEHKLPFITGGPLWSPNGDRMAFRSKDGTIWIINYPEMDNLEQIIQPLDEISYINWSPDGNSIAFVSGTDIYIVDTKK